jgi:hypothetical protein
MLSHLSDPSWQLPHPVALKGLTVTLEWLKCQSFFDSHHSPQRTDPHTGFCSVQCNGDLLTSESPFSSR